MEEAPRGVLTMILDWNKDLVLLKASEVYKDIKLLQGGLGKEEKNSTEDRLIC